MAGTIPRNLLFAANLRYYTDVPWAVPVLALYLYVFWRYLNGAWAPAETSAYRRASLRARALPARVWLWALVTGALAIVALVLGLQLVNRLIALPAQQLPDLSAVPPATVLALLLASAPVAGIVEEAAFRGYMQGPIEQRHGLIAAIVVTGTMFAIVHLDFTPVLWPYYLAVAAIYGTITSLTRSILPAIVLHTAGNLYSNLDLWLHGQAEWQRATTETLIWTSGADRSFWLKAIAVAAIVALALGAGKQLSRLTTR